MPCLLRLQTRKFLCRKITVRFKLNLKADGLDCKMIFKYGKHVERFHSARKQYIHLLFCVAKYLLENPNPFPICTVPVQARHLSTQCLWFCSIQLQILKAGDCFKPAGAHLHHLADEFGGQAERTGHPEDGTDIGSSQQFTSAEKTE